MADTHSGLEGEVWGEGVIGWLWRVLIGRFSCCHHQWEDYRKFSGTYVYGGGEHLIYVLRCKKCGDLKKHDIC